MRVIPLALIAAVAADAAVAVVRAEEAATPPPPRLQCLTTAQTREALSGQKLLDPFQCMRETAHHHQAEALGARLCRLGEALLYEINLLHHDGRIQKFLVDAVTGRPHSGRVEK